MVKKVLKKPAIVSRNSSTSRHEPIHSRMVALTVLLFLAILVIVGRLFILQVVSADQYKTLAADQYTLVKTLTPVRGEIKVNDKYSSEPYTVATSVNQDLAYAIPFEIQDVDGFAQTVSDILKLDKAEIIAKISDKSKKYVVLKKQLSDYEETALKDKKLTGLSFEPETIRFYPEKTFLSQVLGYVGYSGNEKTGRYGLEQYFNDTLKGIPGSMNQEKDASGAWIFGAKRDIVTAKNGSNLILTIDKNIQYQSETILKKAVTDHGANSGSVIVMDPKTGAILAMATYPTFDPNEYSKVTDPKVFNNQPTTDNYEPGSIFKAITMAAAVNEGVITPSSTYVDTGEVKVDGYTIKNSDNKAHGTQTMSQVLEESLNTGVIYAKNRIGNKTFLEYVKKFGFGATTGIELPEAKGDLSGLSGNVEVNYDTASFGQGISVTTLQMMQAYTVFANGGKMMKPYIIQSEIGPGGKIKNTEPKVLGQIISPSAASMVSAMLVNVVELGHGKKAGAPVKQYYVAGKTGTAQVPRADGKGYDPTNNIGSFIGYGPVEDPKFVALVRINHPRDVTYAESSAAPAFGDLAQFIFNYYNVAPTRDVAQKAK